MYIACTLQVDEWRRYLVVTFDVPNTALTAYVAFQRQAHEQEEHIELVFHIQITEVLLVCDPYMS